MDLEGLRRLPTTIKDNIVGRPVDLEATLRQFGVKTPLDPNTAHEAIPSLTVREVAHALHFHAEVIERGESYSTWEVQVPDRLGIVPERFPHNWTTYEVHARYKDGAYQEALIKFMEGKTGLESKGPETSMFYINTTIGQIKVPAHTIEEAKRAADEMARGMGAALRRDIIPSPSIPVLEDENTDKIIYLSNNRRDDGNDQPDNTRESKHGS